jgi:neutral ceramidase
MRIALLLIALALFPRPAFSGELKAGAFAMDISPESYPVSINGGMRDRQAKGAADPLMARCLVLDDGQTTLAITVCDSCMIPRDIFDAAKQLASKATGIPASNMMFSATHTHEAVTVTGVFQSEPEEAYRAFLTKKIAEGVEKAWHERQPARIARGSGKDPSQLFNRRWFMQPSVVNEDPFGNTTDAVKMNPGFKRESLKEPSGPIDPEVGIISLQTKDGKPLALFANYSLHYVGDAPPNMLSGDYYGVFAERMAAKMGGESPTFMAVMSNATSGNINNVDYNSGKPRPRSEPMSQCTAVAISVVDAISKVLPDLKYTSDITLAAVETEIELGVRLPSADDLKKAEERLAKAKPEYSDVKDIYARETVLLSKYPSSVKVLLQAFRIGDLALVSSPCETFCETGLAIKAASPFKPTFVVELANGYNGYLPTPEHHAWGGYETWRARSSYLAPDAEPKIRATLLDLLGQLQAKR